MKRWVGVIHLAALPGSPDYEPPPDTILRRAVEEARCLEEAGAWGLLVENFGDRPFFRRRVPPITVAWMTRIVAAVRETVRIPVGVNVLRNDVLSALAIAAATGCHFIRVNVLTGAVVTDQGIVQGSAVHLLRCRRYWDALDVEIWADVRVKHATALAPRSLPDEIDDVLHRAGAHVVILTGPRTGEAPDVTLLEQARPWVPPGALWLGSGATPENLPVWAPWVDGVIVGSALRRQGRAGEPIEPTRVDQWVRAWQSWNASRSKS